jgi:hypothetical protein
MRKVSIVLIIGFAILLLGCQMADQSWFGDDVGRYQVIHYTSATTPPADHYLRVNTETGWTELFYLDGGKIKYMDSFPSPEIEGKKDLRES